MLDGVLEGMVEGVLEGVLVGMLDGMLEGVLHVKRPILGSGATLPQSGRSSRAERVGRRAVNLGERSKLAAKRPS